MKTKRILKLKYLPSNEIGSIHKDGSGKGWIAWSPTPVSAEETKRLYPVMKDLNVLLVKLVNQLPFAKNSISLKILKLNKKMENGIGL